MAPFPGGRYDPSRGAAASATELYPALLQTRSRLTIQPRSISRQGLGPNNPAEWGDRGLFLAERRLAADKRIHVAIRHVVNCLSNGPAAQSMGRVELLRRESRDRLAEAIGCFGHHCDPLAALFFRWFSVPLEFTDGVTQILFHDFPLERHARSSISLSLLRLPAQRQSQAWRAQKPIPGLNSDNQTSRPVKLNTVILSKVASLVGTRPSTPLITRSKSGGKCVTVK